METMKMLSIGSWFSSEPLERRRIRGFVAVSIVRETRSSCVSLRLIDLSLISRESDGPLLSSSE